MTTVDREEDRKEIEWNVFHLKDQIRELERELIDVMRSDPEYAAYCTRCDLQGRLHKMEIGAFWYSLDYLREIENSAPSDPDEARAYWKEERRRYVGLENDLALRSA